MESQEQNNGNMQRNYSSNESFMTESALIYRLNPDVIVKEIETYLKGGFWYDYYDDKLGQTRTEWMKRGDPKLNDIGVQTIMSVVKSVFNHAVVQGNFDDWRYRNYLKKLHLNLSLTLMRGYKEFNVSSVNNYRTIINTIMNFAEPFLSRLIDNEERKGLNVSVKETVTTQLDKAKNFLGFRRY